MSLASKRLQHASLPGGAPDRARDDDERSSVPLDSRLKPLNKFLDAYHPLEFIIDPVVHSGGVYTLTGTTGMGKTAWAILAALAVSSGRKDILGFPVIQGRVVFMAFEDVLGTQMRIRSACEFLKIDYEQIAPNFIVVDERMSPEQALGALQTVSDEAPVRLIIVDTLAAAFDGNDANDPVSTGRFIGRWRPIAKMAGRPAIIILAHPAKIVARNAIEPYGSIATLNEVDANLTIWMEKDIVELHYYKKLRAAPFAPFTYRLTESTSDAVLDSEKRPVKLTTLRPVGFGLRGIEDAQPTATRTTQAKLDAENKVLIAMASNPEGKQVDWAEAAGVAKYTVTYWLKRSKFTTEIDDVWILTAEGQSRVAGLRRSN